MLHHFSLGEHLGEGGMANVYTAHDSNLERLVALKLLRRDFENDPGHSERFYQEARILADINHPGTIPVFEAGTLPDGHRFYSMQKIEGKTLQTLLDARTKEEIRSRHRTAHFIDIFERACQTVAYLEAVNEVSENQTIFKHVLEEREWIDQLLDKLDNEQ